MPPEKTHLPKPPTETASAGRRRGASLLWNALTLTSAAVIALALVAYYAFKWKTAVEFANAMDHCDDILFCDFVRYFWPEGKEVLVSGQPVFCFFYSAFAALLLIPVGKLPLESAIRYWGVFEVITAILLCVLASAVSSGRSRRALVLSAFLCVISVPVLNNFAWGQVSVLITLSILGSFYAYQRDRHVLAGILLAFGAAIKYYPAGFAIYFLLKRDFRALAAFAIATFVLFFLLPVAVLGPGPWWQFQQISFGGLSQGGWVARNINTQYFGHVVCRVLSKVVFIEPEGDVGDVLTLVAWAVVGGNAWLLWAIQKTAVRAKVALSATILFLSLPFAVRTSWPHYFVYLPFCQLAVLGELWQLFHTRRAWAIALATLSILSVALASVSVFNLFPHWEFYHGFAMLLVANILLLIALYGLIIVAGRESALLPSPEFATAKSNKLRKRRRGGRNGKSGDS